MWVCSGELPWRWRGGRADALQGVDLGSSHKRPCVASSVVPRTLSLCVAVSRYLPMYLSLCLSVALSSYLAVGYNSSCTMSDTRCYVLRQKFLPSMSMHSQRLTADTTAVHGWFVLFELASWADPTGRYGSVLCRLVLGSAVVSCVETVTCPTGRRCFVSRPTGGPIELYIW